MQLPGYGPLILVDGGGFSSVYKTVNKQQRETYAVKVLNPNSKSPEPNVALYREMQALSVTDHQNIVKLHEVVKYNGSICLIMEYIPYNLSHIVKSASLPEAIAKGFMLMLFRGLAHLHELGIIHRDIKPQNLLINSSGLLKICDLGLCRLLPEMLSTNGMTNNKEPEEQHAWTLQVGTHYYRAPELLLGDRGYTKAIDVWAAGCVMAEMLNGEPLFPGTGDFELLILISNILGSPCEETWPGISQLADYGKILFKRKEPADIRAIFRSWSDEAIDLFQHLVIYEPSRRISAREALHHRWFNIDPAPLMAPFNGRTFELFAANAL